MEPVLTIQKTHYAESTVADYITLLKPGVMSLVVFTGLCGLMIAPQTMHPLLAFLSVVAIALGCGASAALNMWYERDIDALMTRTASRPLPQKRIEPDNALSLGILLSFFSIMLLGLASNWLAASILAVAIFFYVFIYTLWLKRRTPQNIVIGGAAGAFPPMIGWVAATGHLSAMPIILFAIVFLWTPPHFWALALYKSGDYAKAGVPMMPVVKGIHHTKKHMVFYTALLFGISLAPWLLGFTGFIYGISAFVLSGIFLTLVLGLYKSNDLTFAPKTFFYSIFYLFALFIALVADHMGAAIHG